MSKVENTICSICLTSPLHPIQPSDQPTTTHWFGLCSLQDSQTATAQTQRKNVVVIMSFRTKLCHLQSCTCAALFRLYELALWYPRPMSAEMCLIPTRMKHQKVCNITHLGTRLQDATRCYKYILHWYSLIFIDIHWSSLTACRIKWMLNCREGTTPPMESHNEEVVLCSLSSFCVIFKLVWGRVLQ